ncbi:MAG: hypothetical protein M1404_04890 [Acidobacteria bacterium]|nr:hypothetical protein [Acidobacteriota bacterium]
MNLAELVTKYVEAAGGFGRPVHLSFLGLPRSETEKIISAFDEDYQVNRYLLLSRERDEVLASLSEDNRIYVINGLECSHISLHPDIQRLL